MAIRPTKSGYKKKAPAKRARRAPDVWDRIRALGKEIPAEELARHPRDGAANLDHYLYGAPKQYPKLEA